MTVNKGIFMDCTLKTFNLKTYFLKFKNTESCLTKMAQSEQKVTSKRPSSCVNSHKSSHWEPMINIVHSPWFTETEFREKRTCFPAQWKPALSSNSLLFLSFFLSTPPPTHSRLLLAYSHPQLPWVEREADKESSEADIPSLTAQKENNSNDHSLITSVEGLDRVWVPRSINREHELFWMQDKHQISQQVLVYWGGSVMCCITAFWIPLQHPKGRQIMFHKSVMYKVGKATAVLHKQLEVIKKCRIKICYL